jgi:ribonuclease BN (tRNA processing enzyme)
MQTWQGEQLAVYVPYSRAGVSHTIWVESEGGALLVDVGDGALRDILEHKLDLKKLKGIAFTHGHFDHMGGFHTVLGFLRMICREESLPLFVPEGCTEVLGLVDNFRVLYAEMTPFEIVVQELDPHRVFCVGDMNVDPFPLIHCGSLNDGVILDPIPAMGYRIDCGGEVVSISGDTGMCPELERLVESADLAIIESTLETSEGIDPEVLKRVHLSEDMAKELGDRAKAHLLVHRGTRKKSKT